jgi:hypothetical protein
MIKYHKVVIICLFWAHKNFVAAVLNGKKVDVARSDVVL